MKLLICALLLCSVTVQAAQLTIGDQKGNARAVMEAAGELSHLPYTVRWVEFPNAAPLLESLNSGHLDAGMVGDGPLAFAVAAGASVKAVQASQYLGNGIIVKQNSPLHNIHQLQGKTVATVKGSAGQNLVLAALAKAGMPADSVRFVFLSPADASPALDNGSVDAVASWEPYVSFGLYQSGDRLLVDGKNFPVSNYLVATDKAIAGKHAALLDFSQRLSRARTWGLQHPEAYARTISRILGIPENVTLSKVKREDNSPVNDLSLLLVRQQAAIDTFTQTGLIKPGLKAGSLLSRDFFSAPKEPQP